MVVSNLTSAIFVTQRREQPHIAKPDRVANQHQDELSPALPSISSVAINSSSMMVVMVVMIMMIMIFAT